MIPKIIHFINIGTREFLYFHYIVVRMARAVNPDFEIMLHYTDEPGGQWWEKAKSHCTMNKVEYKDEIFGNKIKNPAHVADVIRLEILKEIGGIYLDLDVICVNSFEPLLKEDMVMGIEPDNGLCNAVIIAQKGAKFIEDWYAQYKNFDSDIWNYHSVKLPWRLYKNGTHPINVQDQYAFFYPLPNDPWHVALWGKKISKKALVKRFMRDIVKGALSFLSSDKASITPYSYSLKNVLRSAAWHEHKFKNSYCMHMWEGYWRKDYLSKMTPEYIQSSPSCIAGIIRSRLGDNAIGVSDD